VHKLRNTEGVLGLNEWRLGEYLAEFDASNHGLKKIFWHMDKEIFRY